METGGGVALEVRVLGPLELVADDGPVALPMKQRRLLAALAIGVGQTRSADLLIDAVWGETPPASASNLLQVYVSQLRKALPGPARVATFGSAYALEIADSSLDAARFERLLEEGRAAMSAGNPRLAGSLFRRAHGLWRGEAYGEFAYEQFAHAEAERLEELRLACVEERLEAELALGQHAGLLPELESLVSAHPLRERLRAQTMLALYRCGRQTEALELYADARRRLREELGLEPGSELRDLQRRILQHDPTLVVASAAEPPPDLLAPATVLLGRERELAALRQLLLRDQVRLLVLSGAGGSGKTRLALQAARETAASFADGARFVDLAPLLDPGLVPGAIMRALGIQQAHGDPLDTLAAALAPRELLILLDNAEHLRAAAPMFVELLARAPRLTLLVTSRVVLHLSGEHVFPVEPLAADAAVALFHQRAREAEPRFQPTTVDEQAVRRICQRLDGLPLAIELAASRIRALSTVELLARLDARLPLLTGGPRDLPARQQSLRATLAWSYQQLTDEERRDLCRLSVLADGCTLEAAEAVAGTSVEGLAALIDHNLIHHTVTANGSRYRMHETIRQYALEQLEASPEVEEVRRGHAEFFLALANSANLNPGKLNGRGQRLEIAIAEQNNLRAALTWALTSGSATLGLQLAVAMDQFWTLGDPREGMRWFAALLDRPDTEPVEHSLHAHALRGYGSCAAILGDDETAQRLWEQSLALFELVGDEQGRAVLLHRLAICKLRQGELDRARELVAESCTIHKQNDDQWNRTWGLAQTTGTLGAIARESGDLERAFELIEQSAKMAYQVGVPWWESGMLSELACLALNARHLDQAEIRARHSLGLAEQLHDRAGRIFGVGLLAAVAAQHGQSKRAGRLWGAIENEDAAAPLGGWHHHRQTCEALIRETTGPEFEQGCAEGRELTLDDAVSLALTTAEVPVARPRTVAEPRLCERHTS
jgi:predicted ATPase/DNA-binding SARP family transcriptional activator